MENKIINLSKNISYIPLKTNIGVISIEKNDTTEIILIDSGHDKDFALKILEILNSNFKNPKVKVVINTHSHADHCGGNPELLEKTNCEIWTSKGEGAIMEHPLIETELIWGGMPISDITTHFLMAEPSKSTKIIEEGKPIIINSIKIEPISLPGHYIDQIGLLVTDTDGKKTFFMGDAISGRNVIRKYWIQYLLDEKKTKDSLMKLSTIEANFYIPSHGNPVDNIEGLAELNIIALLETENLIIDILRSPHTTEEILKEVADRNNISMKIAQYVLIGSTIRSYITALYEDKRITYKIQDNKMLWQRNDHN